MDTQESLRADRSLGAHRWSKSQLRKLRFRKMMSFFYIGQGEGGGPSDILTSMDALCIIFYHMLPKRTARTSKTMSEKGHILA